MKKIYFTIVFFVVVITLKAEQEFHVFPENHVITPGTMLGDGSLQNPWDLQTALNQTPKIVNGGDIIWLHGGIYNGHYESKIKSTLKGKYIKVASFPNEWAILNGNVQSELNSVLTVRGSYVIYKDFEVTCLGSFSRNERDVNFNKITGISHDSGVDCKFINLIIHNNPGSGFGSWRNTSNTEINNCIIFNNGYYSKKRGSGVGMYVQNLSDKNRLIKNNIIFNNYYKGVEVWSDNRKANSEYVKNITLQNNVIFNSGFVSGTFRDNLIVATNDENGINIAKHIMIKNNIFYHNTSLSKTIENSDAPSITLGFNEKSPIENIKIYNNIIIGRKNAIRILEVKSLFFNNNTVYSGYVRFRKSVLKHINIKNWKFSDNTYYTRTNKPIRVQGFKDFTIEQWNIKYGLEKQSIYKNYKEFDLNNVLNITKNDYKPYNYRVVLFDKEGDDVIVDLSNHNLKAGMNYTIKDVENFKEIVVSGILNDTFKVNFPMSITTTNPYKTLNNFGVYIIEFENVITTEIEDVNPDFITRFFKWLF